MDHKLRCVTVGNGDVSGKAKRYIYYRVAIYETCVRKKDGGVVWKLVEKIGNSHCSYDLTKKTALEYAAENNIPFRENVRQNQEVTRHD